MIPEKERNKIAKDAQKYAKKGKLQEAIAEYQKLLTENSVDLSVRSTLGDLYVRSNQKEKAIEEFQKIASHYQERGLYSQSIAVYKKINKLNPSDIKIGIKLADLYYNQGFLSEAKREYQRIADNLKESHWENPILKAPSLPKNLHRQKTYGFGSVILAHPENFQRKGVIFA